MKNIINHKFVEENFRICRLFNTHEAYPIMSNPITLFSKNPLYWNFWKIKKVMGMLIIDNSSIAKNHLIILNQFDDDSGLNIFIQVPPFLCWDSKSSSNLSLLVNLNELFNILFLMYVDENFWVFWKIRILGWSYSEKVLSELKLKKWFELAWGSGLGRLLDLNVSSYSVTPKKEMFFSSKCMSSYPNCPLNNEL